VLIERWRQHDNRFRPHSSLGYRPPAPEAIEIPSYPVPQGTVPLLDRFFLRYFDGHVFSRHLNAIMVMPAGAAEDASPEAGFGMPVVEEGEIAVILQDKNADDPIAFEVSHRVYADLRRYNIRDVGCVGGCERELPQPIVPRVGNVFVLVGFELFFTGGRDHHIDEIGIHEEGGRLVVAFNDRNDDDVSGYSVDCPRPGCPAP
jgi:hypothetical protein